MTSRKIGERAETYFDSIDLQILETINSSSPNGIGVLELTNRLALTHKNLKPHLDKLMFLDIVFAWKDKDGKVKLFTAMENMDLLGIEEFNGNEKEYREALKKQEHDKALLKYLDKVREYNYNFEMSKNIDIDLRKSKEIRNVWDSITIQGINTKKSKKATYHSNPSIKHKEKAK